MTKGVSGDVDLETFRYMALNSLRAINMKFRSDFEGPYIVAVDSSPSWRKEIFPFYKLKRHDSRESSPIDWELFYSCLSEIVQEIDEHLPFHVFKFDRCEADDVIGVLARKSIEEFKPVLLVSGDKDFIQLYIDSGTLLTIYDNVRDRYFVHDDPKRYLFEHIMKGDSGDSVPNVLSPENSFAIKQRMKPMRQKRLDDLWENGIDVFEQEQMRRVKLNRKLIDLSCTPRELQQGIIHKYNGLTPKRTNLLSYFQKHGLGKFASQLGDFRA